MEKEKRNVMPLYVSATALVGWFALILQLYIIVSNAIVNNNSVVSSIIKYFSYFTILTNILAALSLTLSLIMQSSALGKFLRSASAKAAIAVYIIIVGIVYNLVLRQLWDPKGLQLIADILLHQVIPIAYTVYWVVFVPKSNLAWKQPFIWLIYPLIYLLYAIIRGAVTGHYPYPFIDVSQIGFSKMLVNTTIMMIAFISIGFLLVAIDKRKKHTKLHHKL